MAAETPNSNWPQQGGNEFFLVISSPEVGKAPDVTAGVSGSSTGVSGIHRCLAGQPWSF